MCPMLHILYTNDYGLPNHPCDSGATVNGQFNDSQDVINYIMNSIYQSYHAGEDIYEDANECQHGHAVQFIIMEIVRHNQPPNEPLVVTIDIYDHDKTYNEMVHDFFSIQDNVDRVSELVL